MPTVCVALPCLLAALGATLRRNHRRATVYLLLAILPTTLLLFVENRLWLRGERSNDTIRIVHWNIARGRNGLDAVAGLLSRKRADIIVLSDLPETFDKQAFIADVLSGAQSVLLGGMLILSRDGLGDITRPEKDSDLIITGVTCRAKGRSVRLFAADLNAALSMPRYPRLRRVADAMRKHQPDVVVGDFNALRRSWCIARSPGYRHAYNVAGSGWSGTWPVALPLWAIDQCIVGDRARAVRYDLVSTPCSDHRMQVLDFTLIPETDP